MHSGTIFSRVPWVEREDRDTCIWLYVANVNNVAAVWVFEEMRRCDTATHFFCGDTHLFILSSTPRCTHFEVVNKYIQWMYTFLLNPFARHMLNNLFRVFCLIRIIPESLCMCHHVRSNNPLCHKGIYSRLKAASNARRLSCRLASESTKQKKKSARRMKTSSNRVVTEQKS